MALKPDRRELDTDISFFMNTAVERGGIVTLFTGGSGAALDQSAAVVCPTGATPSGTYPVGLLMNDMVNIDQTRQHMNWHQDEVQLGGKVTILKRGWVVTNVIDTGVIVAGKLAYYQPYTFGGVTNVWCLSPNNHYPGSSGVRVGKFLSSKDEDGYVKVEIDINT